VFEPRTFSTDWEVMVIDRLNRNVRSDRCHAFAGILQEESGLPIHMDWEAIEFAPGINNSLEQFADRIRRVTDRAAELVGQYDLDLFPAAAHPLEENFNASHVHVGSLHDESEGIHLENQLMLHVPAFAALAANSPFSHGRRGRYKSYRVRHMADGCTQPSEVRDPHLSQPTWGGDASPKLFNAATMEVRIIDCASSRRLLAEMATFIAAYLHHRGEAISHARPTRRQYRQSLTNRWAAARYGMQAVFAWGEATRPVADVLDEMLDACGDALAHLGATRADLALIDAMIRKRTCQADFAIDLGRRYADPYLLTSAYAKMLRHWEVFEEYLAAAPVLEPAPAPDEQAILAEHLACVGEGTSAHHLRGAMRYPAPLTDRLVETMVRRGWVRRELTPQGEPLLHRTP